MMRRRWVRAVVALLLPAASVLAADDVTAPSRGAVRVSGARGASLVEVEVARTSAEHERGLMGRSALPPDEGMLFLYSSPRSGDSGFWMYHTRIALDIAFVDTDGRIVALETMQPCKADDPDRCPVYLPRVSYQSALEVNAGWFAAHGIRPGDRVQLIEP